MSGLEVLKRVSYFYVLLNHPISYIFTLHLSNIIERIPLLLLWFTNIFYLLMLQVNDAKINNFHVRCVCETRYQYLFIKDDGWR